MFEYAGACGTLIVTVLQFGLILTRHLRISEAREAGEGRGHTDLERMGNH